MRSLLFILASMCFGPPAYAAPPGNIRVHYDLLYGSIRGATVDENFTLKQDHYTIESISRAVGLVAVFKPETIRVTSEGKLTSHGLQPFAFASTRKLDSDRNTRADFDWTHQQITLTNRTGKQTLPLPPDTQDRLSAMYQFMFLALEKTDKLDFHMTNGDKLDIYNYLITHDQTVTVPLGTFKAQYVTSVPEAGSNRTEIWLATEHSNFPYKMVITDQDGTRISQILTHIEFVP
ncbi:MAG TPA: DUF3108 domain-containing protein [Gallionella sp.]|nr:DUF3108 domain-containing protein [Gallionella sp.]